MCKNINNLLRIIHIICVVLAEKAKHTLVPIGSQSKNSARLQNSGRNFLSFIRTHNYVLYCLFAIAFIFGKISLINSKQQFGAVLSDY